MAADVRYLSNHSLAVYEATLIEQFSVSHRRNVQIQTFTFVVFALTSFVLAAMTIILPASVQGVLRLLLGT